MNKLSKKPKEPLSRILLKKVKYEEYSPHPIVGVDEVGRGCLAGPVFAAAVCLKSDSSNHFLTDSKLISEKRREEFAPLIIAEHWTGIGSASVEEIDELNILQASLLAMQRAVLELEKQMGVRSGHILVDGNQRIPYFERQQTTVIKGDLRCLPISAASIVAKVARDTLMRELSKDFPVYGFESHKGYGSEAHRKAISIHGPISHHRKSFSGVREYVAQFAHARP
jgi:ribonuclease HII